MKLWKKALSCVLIAAIVLTLAACGAKQTDSAPSAPSANNSPTSTEQTPPDDAAEPPASQQAEQTPEAAVEAAPAEILSLDDMSEEEYSLLNCVFGYCDCLADVLYSGGSEEQLAEVTSEEFIGQHTFSCLYAILDETGIDAASTLLANHTSDFISLLSAMGGYDAFMDTYGYSPESFPYPGGWSSLYSEFQTRKADALAASLSVIDTPEKAFQAIEISAADRVMYHENGVEITFTGCTISSDRVNFNFHVSNQNPDNKKVSLYFSDISINRLIIAKASGDRGLDGLTSGEEADVVCTRYLNQLTRLLEKFGETVETMPIETLTFKYSLQIGSDSEKEQQRAELKTALYREGDIEALWGDYVGSFPKEGENIDIYAKSGDFGVVAVAVNVGASPRIVSFTTCINGKKAAKLNETDDTLSFDPGDSQIIFSTPKTDEEIRKEYEVGNSELLQITFEYFDTSVVVYSK